MESASFSPSQLALLRELEGVSKSNLARDLEVSAATVSGWENGGRSPTATNIKRLAIRFSVEPEFFNFVDRERPAEQPFFRSLRATTASERSKCGAYSDVVARIVRSLVHSIDFPVFTGFEDLPTDSPELAAGAFRQLLSLGNEPIPNLMRLVENHGVFAVYGPSSSISVDAYSRHADPNPVVVLNPMKYDYYRQRFDLAHEIGHLILHSGEQAGTKSIESEANRFAAELLAPTESVANELPALADQSGWRQLRILKERWGLSMQALIYRAHSLGVMNENSYRNAMVTVSKRGWRRNEPGNQVVLEAPTLLPSAVKLLCDFGYTVEQLARQAGVPNSYFQLAVRQSPHPL